MIKGARGLGWMEDHMLEKLRRQSTGSIFFYFKGSDSERTSVEKGPMNQELKSSKNEGE